MMSGDKKLKVSLISWTRDPEETIVAAIRQCYSKLNGKELKKKTDEDTRRRLIKQVIGSGHTSTLEHASFSFAIEGLSRVAEVQLVRHRVGAAFSVQSGRYVDRSKVEYKMPAAIKNSKYAKRFSKLASDCQSLYGDLVKGGIAKEDARFCQLQSLKVNLVLTMNARALLHFFQLRCCQRAQWEIRELAEKMLELVRPKAPVLFELAGPSCVTEGVCWEGGMSCDRWKGLGAVLKVRGKK